MATMVQAIRMALHVGEERLGVTDVFGEDVGPPLGGVFTQSQGLKTAWNSPLDERGIVGAAIGLAMAGQKPVCEIRDPNPVMFLAPKALLRQKALAGEELPGEPPDERQLAKMIDAPLGDRTQWRPQWPALEDLFIPLGEARTARKGRDVTVVC